MAKKSHVTGGPCVHRTWVPLNMKILFIPQKKAGEYPNQGQP